MRVVGSLSLRASLQFQFSVAGRNCEEWGTTRKRREPRQRRCGCIESLWPLLIWVRNCASGSRYGFLRPSAAQYNASSVVCIGSSVVTVGRYEKRTRRRVFVHARFLFPVRYQLLSRYSLHGRAGHYETFRMYTSFDTRKDDSCTGRQRVATHAGLYTLQACSS